MKFTSPTIQKKFSKNLKNSNIYERSLEFQQRKMAKMAKLFEQNNKKNNVKTDENDLFVDNNTNSIRIDIKFLESDTVFPMEKIEKLGSNLFVKNYAGISFKCTKKEYHEKNNMIKYMYFEEI